MHICGDELLALGGKEHVLGSQPFIYLRLIIILALGRNNNKLVYMR